MNQRVILGKRRRGMMRKELLICSIKLGVMRFPYLIVSVWVSSKQIQMQNHDQLNLSWYLKGKKDKLLYNAKNFRGRGDLDGVFIHQDLTPAQRERRHRLVEELKQRKIQGEEDLIVINNKTVHRRNTWIRNNLAVTAGTAEQA